MKQPAWRGKPMAALTMRERDLLAFIARYMNREGIAPKLDEMAAGIGLRAKSAVWALLNGLEQKGYIRRQWMKRRALEIVKLPPALGMTVEAERAKRYAECFLNAAEAKLSRYVFTELAEDAMRELRRLEATARNA